MAEKKKMTVAEILAAARKGTAGGAPAPAESPAEASPSPVASTPPAESDGDEAVPVVSEPAAAAPLKPRPASAAGGKPSVADILAMARAGGAKPAAPAAAKASAGQPAATKPATEKPATKPKPAADRPATSPAKAAPAETTVAAGTPMRDTSSILAAARGANRPGPMSKSEAAAKLKPEPPKVSKASAPAVVPPMPAKPDYAKPKPAKVAAPAGDDRRFFLGVLIGSFLGMGFTAVAATTGLWTLAFARFMFPNVLTEPPSKFKVGYPADFPPGSVEEKFKAQYGVWVVNAEYQGQREIVALKTVCTHLGCTPNWLDAEQKFKCPCHGSGFYKDGINFEGPAPRPLERYAIRLADDGQLEIDKSKTFQEELGQWSDAASFVAV